MSIHLLRYFAAFHLSVFLLIAQAEAVPVAILNPGFEDPYLAGNLPAQFNGDVPPTAFPTGGAPSGWAPFGSVGSGNSIGVLNPGIMVLEPLATNYPDGAPEGDNVAILYANGFSGGPEFGLEQTLAHTFQDATRYTLTVEVGNIASGESVVAPYSSFGFFDLRGFPGYRIEVFAGATMVAQDLNTLLPDEGTFETSTLEFSLFGFDPALIGEQLTIRLVNLNNQDLNDPAVSGLEVNFDDIQLDAGFAIPGDANLDGTVDLLDLDILGTNFGTVGGALFIDGDYNLDGNVDLLDLDIKGLNFGMMNSTSIPEPRATWLLLATVVLVNAVRRA